MKHNNLIQLTTENIKDNPEPITTSLKIAEVFEKRHKNILRDIINLDCSEEFSQLNFEPTFYLDSFNRKQTMYNITKDGFVFLVMGYNGKKACKFKEEYIKAFNFMEKELLARLNTRHIAISIRKGLTDSIKDNIENNTQFKKFAYSNYTKLVYKIVFGMDCKKIKEKFKIPEDANMRDYFTKEELENIQKIEGKIASYIDTIKDFESLSDQEVYKKIKDNLLTNKH